MALRVTGAVVASTSSDIVDFTVPNTQRKLRLRYSIADRVFVVGWYDGSTWTERQIANV